jgi:hypothetical protein
VCSLSHPSLNKNIMIIEGMLPRDENFLNFRYEHCVDYLEKKMISKEN